MPYHCACPPVAAFDNIGAIFSVGSALCSPSLTSYLYTAFLHRSKDRAIALRRVSKRWAFLDGTSVGAVFLDDDGNEYSETYLRVRVA